MEEIEEVKWFADRLRELRQAAGLTREELADRAGMTVGGLRDLEQGVNRPSWASVLAVCKALGVSCETFLQRPAPRPPARPGRPRKTPPADPGATAGEGPEPEPEAPPAAPKKRGRKPKT